MKVYTLNINYDYEGSDLVGIYTDVRRAEDVAKRIQHGDSVTIESWVLNETEMSLLV